MKSSIWLLCYVALSVLVLGFNCMHWLVVFKDPALIVSITAMCAIALQVPLFFFLGRDH